MTTLPPTMQADITRPFSTIKETYWNNSFSEGEEEIVATLAAVSAVHGDPLVSDRARQITKDVLECGVQPLIMCVGIPGNVISCVVFALQGLKDRIHLLLFSLAVADLTNLLSLFLPRLSCLRYLGVWGEGEGVGAENWRALTTSFLTTVSRWSGFVSGLLMLVMSVDRCLSVTLPLRAVAVLRYRPMLLTIVVSYLLPLACFLPNLLIYRVMWTTHPSTNQSLAYIGIADDVIPRSVPIRIVGILNVVVKPVAVIIVIACCLVTIVTLRRASRKRVQLQGMETKEKKSEGKGENRITAMLVFLCVVYAVLVLPEVCSALVNHFVPEFFMFQTYHNTFLVVYVVIFTASCLNSSANFVAYLCLSSSFRQTMKNFCTRRNSRR